MTFGTYESQVFLTILSNGKMLNAIYNKNRREWREREKTDNESTLKL